MTNSTPSPLQRLRAGLILIEDALLALMLGVMLVTAAAQIVLRNVWGGGLSWGDPLVRVLVLWVGLLGAIAAAREDNHITIDILTRFLPPRLKTAARLLTDLFTALVCALLSWHAARMVLMEKDAAATAFAEVPAWVCEAIIPFGFAVISARFLVMFFTRVRDTMRNTA